MTEMSIEEQRRIEVEEEQRRRDGEFNEEFAGELERLRGSMGGGPQERRERERLMKRRGSSSGRRPLG